MAIVMCIPDTHIPFEHPDALSFVKTIRNKYKPSVIIHAGDEVDLHGYSDYLHDPDGLGPLQEFDLAVERLQAWYKAFPVVNVCHSNHTTRILKKTVKAGVAKKFLRSIKDILGAPKGWNWAEEFEAEGVRYLHGEGFTGAGAASTAAVAYNQPVVLGHIHAFAGIQYINSYGYNLWGVNSGCLVDNTAYAFAYAKHSKHKPVLGATIVRDGEFPIFIPMTFNKSGTRWSGKV